MYEGGKRQHSESSTLELRLGSIIYQQYDLEQAIYGL